MRNAHLKIAFKNSHAWQILCWISPRIGDARDRTRAGHQKRKWKYRNKIRNGDYTRYMWAPSDRISSTSKKSKDNFVNRERNRGETKLFMRKIGARARVLSPIDIIQLAFIAIYGE